MSPGCRKLGFLRQPSRWLALAGALSLVGVACTPTGEMEEPNEGGRSGSGGSAGSGGSGGSGGSPAGGQGGQNGGQAGSNTGGSGGSVGGNGGSPGGTGGSSSGGAGGGSAGSGGSSSGGTGGSSSGGTGGGSAGGAGGGGSQVDAGGTGGSGPGGGEAGGSTERFSFFYTSLDAMRRLSKSQNGFGGDFRFGTTNGLEGADKICQTIAGDVGFGNKTWRAFLSAVRGPDGQPVHAIDRIGEGPWYDRRGRLVAMNKAGLIGTSNRPAGEAAVVNDLPDETGQGTRRLGDTHDAVTGSNRQGRLRFNNLANTCQDWTSSASGSTTIGFGHSWPAGSGMHWAEVHTGRSCAAGVNLVQNGGGNGSSIGAGGGWGGFYCFALQP